MSLEDDFANVATTRPTFEAWVDQHPERDTLYAAAANPSIGHAAFMRVVKNAGAAVGKDKIAEWRKANGYVAS